MAKRLVNIVSNTALIVVLCMAVSMLAFKALGGGTYAVLSASMEPTYTVGSLLYVLPTDTASLAPGDVITYTVAENTTVTHRIADIVPAHGGDGAYFTTKGDANSTADAEPLDPRNVVGAPVFSVPYLGFLITFIKQPPGLYLAFAVIGLLLIAGLLPLYKKRS